MKHVVKTEKDINKGLLRFRRKGDLTGRKLAEYLPSMLITNLSTLLLVTVDGIVAGNFVGNDALSAVNVFYPVTVLVGAFTTLAASGISTSLSTAMGRNDAGGLDRVKGASLRIMIGMAVFVGIAQIPMVLLVVRSYGLSDELYKMTMQYAVGIMICAPLGVVSTVGTYQLQIGGKMKMLMTLSIIEGVSNLGFDLLFTGLLRMGVAGTGYGTAAANLIRCSLTVWYLYRFTDMYRSDTKKVAFSDVKNILETGVPDFSYALMLALQNYLIMKILLAAFGVDGGVIKGVCTLCFSITNVLISGITGSMRPLMGLYAGAEDKAGLRILMQQGAVLNIISAGIATIVTEFHPEWFYTINGVHDIPEGGLQCVKLFALYFIPKGFNLLIRMYLTNRHDSRYATVLTVVGNATLPLFAFILWKAAPEPYIFLSYLATETVVLAMSYVRYRKWLEKDGKETEENGKDIELYMTVHPDEAVEASRELRSFAEEHGISKRIAYRAALCMEEMVAYARAVEAVDPVKKMIAKSDYEEELVDFLTFGGTAPWTEEVKEVMKEVTAKLSVEVIVRFKGNDEAVFIEMDDGTCIALDKNAVSRKLITDNYELLRKVAKNVEYQYILNMNYTRFTFSDN